LECYRKQIENIEYDVYPTYYPIGNGMRNIDKAIEDLKYILEN
jgi:DNA polymerase